MLNDVTSDGADSEEKAAQTEQGVLAYPLKALEAAGGQGHDDAADDLEAVSEFHADDEAESHALAIATDGGPLVAEIELQPLAIRPILPPSAPDSTAVQPASGFWGRYRLFILTVVVPMLIGSLYLFAVAAPRYASSASFIVRAVAPSAPLTGGIGQSSGKSAGSGRSAAAGRRAGRRRRGAPGRPEEPVGCPG